MHQFQHLILKCALQFYNILLFLQCRDLLYLVKFYFSCHPHDNKKKRHARKETDWKLLKQSLLYSSRCDDTTFTIFQLLLQYNATYYVLHISWCFNSFVRDGFQTLMFVVVPSNTLISHGKFKSFCHLTCSSV